ncbi:hypothetical protein [Nocardia sp. NPDC059239]|uniref:hypothetical protein n=1 Tax=Nocardia sp. NPDC059239 TaxID=3346785 RepID=UPI003692BD4E
MPNWHTAAGAQRTGLYAWLGNHLERRHAQPDPRDPGPGAAFPPVPEALANFRAGEPVAVPVWELDGHSAYGAGFVGAVPKDRTVRARTYVVRTDDAVTPV